MINKLKKQLFYKQDRNDSARLIEISIASFFYFLFFISFIWERFICLTGQYKK